LRPRSNRAPRADAEPEGPSIDADTFERVRVDPRCVASTARRRERGAATSPSARNLVRILVELALGDPSESPTDRRLQTRDLPSPTTHAISPPRIHYSVRPTNRTRSHAPYLHPQTAPARGRSPGEPRARATPRRSRPRRLRARFNRENHRSSQHRITAPARLPTLAAIPPRLAMPLTRSSAHRTREVTSSSSRTSPRGPRVEPHHR
jgi:hypothetical protein